MFGKAPARSMATNGCCPHRPHLRAEATATRKAQRLVFSTTHGIELRFAGCIRRLLFHFPATLARRIEIVWPLIGGLPEIALAGAFVLLKGVGAGCSSQQGNGK